MDQRRWLRCGLCAWQWEADRLWCPFCGERSPAALGYLSPEGEEGKWRAATCSTCRTYLKVLSTLSALNAPSLLVADLASLTLDVLAADAGLAPPVDRAQRVCGMSP